MPLSMNEQYTIAAVCFVGGTSSVVTHLWLLFNFLPLIRMPKALRSLHIHLAVANLMVVVFFFFGAVSHFEQAWIFGNRACVFYVFWCKFAPIAATGILAVCVYGEYQHAVDPSLEKKNVSYTILLALAWGYGLLWGYGALAYAEYGTEPAGFTCAVIWYKIQPYVTYMAIFGYGLPMLITFYFAALLWCKGLLIDDGLAKVTAVLCLTMALQFSAYGGAYIAVCLGFTPTMYFISFPQVWTKVLGVVHPFVYRTVLARDDSETKRD